MHLRRSGLAVLAGAAVVAAGLAGAPAVAAPSSGHGHGGLDARIAKQVHGMTLAEKVGQMFVTYAYGSSATAPSAADVAQNRKLYGVDTPAQVVAKYHLGGVIYFTWTHNLQDPKQMATLSNGIQKAAVSSGAGVPLLVSTDQEGGIITRITAPLAVTPGNMAVGATFSPGTAYRVARDNGAQLHALGINADDAPVLDVNTNPDNTADGPRSFGDHAHSVARMAAASIRGYHAASEATSAKHFPGLGSTSINTDNGVAVTHETRAELMANDIPPFRAAIASGTDTIMAAHIVAPALDPSGAPASMSKPIVTGLLRDKLHYDGLVITDSLTAQALKNLTLKQRILHAVNAGDDQLLMPGDLAAAEQDLIGAVTDGTVPESRIDTSVTRILRVKYRRGIVAHPYVDAGRAASRVGTDRQNRTMSEAARHSITLLRNSGNLLPLSADSTHKVLVTGWGAGTSQRVADAIAGHGVTTQRFYTGSDPNSALIDKVVSAAADNDVTVVITDNAWGDTGQQNLVKALTASGAKVVALSVGGPYDIAHFTKVPAFLAAYDWQQVSTDAAVAAMFGTQPTGRLPVTIRAADGSGTVLYHYGAGLHYPRG